MISFTIVDFFFFRDRFSECTFSHFLFKEFITEWQAQKSTQRKPRHPKLGAEGIAPNEVPFVHYALQK
jgi:hypothetical protein